LTSIIIAGLPWPPIIRGAPRADNLARPVCYNRAVSSSIPPRRAASLTIVALGDSTTAGTPGYQSPLEAPPDGQGRVESQFAYWLTRMHAGWRVLNRGINGQRADEIRARFERDVLGERPDAVVVIAGVNDIYQGRPAASVVRELEAIYDLARERGLALVAGSILPYDPASADENDRMHSVNAWIQAYAARHAGLVFCDTRAAVAAPGRPDRLIESPDGLHPSPAGYRLMALALEPAIRSAVKNAGSLR
jgi:lysophospholipase L1-like esterase